MAERRLSTGQNNSRQRKTSAEIVAQGALNELENMVNQVREPLNLQANHADQTIESAILPEMPVTESNNKYPVLGKATERLTECAPELAENLNLAAQHLTILCDNNAALSSSVNDDDDSNEGQSAEESIDQNLTTNDTNATASASSCTVPKDKPSGNQSQKKRHIMISYNRSSIDTCKKIYSGLVGLNYKVWMDLTDLFDDILVGMAQAIENSYIVLLCINQQYFDSQYCRLEAEYAAEKRVKFIPCLMEKDFAPTSWLGIIKGSNYHIDFSSPDEFDQSFNDLVRQINNIEEQLALQPRQTPCNSPAINLAQNPPFSTNSNSDYDLSVRRFDGVIRQYKESIRKSNHSLNGLERSELSELIVKLRQELFSDDTAQTISDNDIADGEDGKVRSNEQLLQELISTSLQQNQVLLRLVDRLTTPQENNMNNQRNLDIDSIIKVIIAIMLLWTLNVLCQKE